MSKILFILRSLELKPVQQVVDISRMCSLFLLAKKGGKKFFQISLATCKGEVREGVSSSKHMNDGLKTWI